MPNAHVTRVIPTGRLGALSLLGVVLLAGCLSPTGGVRDAATGPTAAGGSATGDDRTTVASGTSEPCRRSTATETQNASRRSADRPEALESRLYGLVTAENRTAYAADRELSLRDGRVLVEIGLRDGAALPAGIDLEETARHDDLVEGYVPVCQLVPLADAEGITYVQSPRRPVLDSPSDHSPSP